MALRPQVPAAHRLEHAAAGLAFSQRPGRPQPVTVAPPWSASSKDAHTLGESKRGQQNQSTVPSVVTSAAVCRSPINP